MGYFSSLIKQVRFSCINRFIITENIDETENDPARHTNKRINYVYFLYKNFP